MASAGQPDQGGSSEGIGEVEDMGNVVQGLVDLAGTDMRIRDMIYTGLKRLHSEALHTQANLPPNSHVQRQRR